MESTITIIPRAQSKYTWIERYSPQTSIFQGKSYFFIKRLVDLVLVLTTLPFWLPLLGICALLIKIVSPDGPVIFVQHRTGFGGRRFKMYKFRTMVPNAEELKKELGHLNELQWPDFKITDDPRIIKFGSFLRKTSLDEMPQLWNVLKGDMSLVGPRPTSFSAKTYKLWHTSRLDVKPGITGLWQLIGRGKTEFDDRLRMDITYIKHRCLRVDLEILMRTIIAVLGQRGAY